MMKLHDSGARRGRGFTLIELLVATSLTVLMLYIINLVFLNAVNAVGQGAALSDIITNSRALNEQLERDAAAMVGPHEGHLEAGLTPLETGGIMIILQRQIGDWDEDGVLEGDTNDNGVIDLDLGESQDPMNPEGVPFYQIDGQISHRLVRSDQLVFIRKRKPSALFSPEARTDTFPIAPESETGFTSQNVRDEVAPYIKVWYGHVLRTDPDGTDPDDNPSAADNPLAAGALGRPGPNELATHWVLGRQALFLGDAGMGGSVPGIHVNGGWYNAGGALMTGYTEPAAAVKYLFMGTTDFAYYGLADTDPNAVHTYGAIVGGDPADWSSAVNGTKRLWSPVATAGTFSNTTYRARAYTEYTYGRKRLRVNPNPAGSGFESWQVAQTHPYFMGNISDFIVEFAADYFKGVFDDNPDGGVDAVDSLFRWYTHTPFANQDITPLDTTLPPRPDEPVTYTVPATAWAQAAYDNNPSIPHADAAFVWRHDDDESGQKNSWPMMLRIRYRLHDTRGLLQSFVGQKQPDGNVYGGPQSGRWFEITIPVNRP